MSKIFYIMKHLFPNKLKRISGIIFYLSLVAGLYLFSTDQFDQLLVIKVPQFFSYEMTITTPNTENIIGTSKVLWIENGFLDEILTIIIIVSGIINSFSREPVEDELISKMRMESLTLSLYINFGLVIVSTLVFFELLYFNVLVFNLFTILLFFNIIFKFNLYKHYKSS